MRKINKTTLESMRKELAETEQALDNLEAAFKKAAPDKREAMVFDAQRLSSHFLWLEKEIELMTNELKNKGVL